MALSVETERELRQIVGREGILTRPSELLVYQCDAYTVEKQTPDAVLFPTQTSQIADIVRTCRRAGVPIFSRGAGTGLAGGSTPLGGGVVLMLTRMNRILNIDLANRMAEVESGVLNLQLAGELNGTGYQYAPDPSSQVACTIGGNIATNAGGPHTLKYGVTVNHVLGIEAVLGDGTVVTLGPERDPASLDLIGLLVGSEGTLGIITKAWLRLTPVPQGYRTLRAVFERVDDACTAVSDIIAAGMVPAAMEVMDQGILRAVEEAFQFGFPADAGAIVVIELEGIPAALDEQEATVAEVCHRRNAREVLRAKDEQQRALLWQCRKSAVAAVGRISPSYFIQDGVVPRTRLPEIIQRVAEIAQKHQIRIVNVAHAGDGNVHPILLYDDHNPDELRRAQAAGRDLLQACIDLGGSVTAEHGVGVEKIEFIPRLFASEDLTAMRRAKEVFDPGGILAPGKLIPMPGGRHAAAVAELEG